MNILTFEEFLNEAASPEVAKQRIKAQKDFLKNKAKASKKVSATFTKINYDNFERLSNNFEESEIDGNHVTVAYNDNDKVIGMWYTKAKIGSKSSAPFNSEVEYSEEDTNYPW